MKKIRTEDPFNLGAKFGRELAELHKKHGVRLERNDLIEVARTACRAAMDRHNRTCRPCDELLTDVQKLAWGKQFSPAMARIYVKVMNETPTVSKKAA